MRETQSPPVIPGISEATYVSCGWEDRFRNPFLPLTSCMSMPCHYYEAIGSLGKAMLDRLGCCGSMRLALGAIQLNWMQPHAVRGYHFDNPRHGDVIVSLTLVGSCCVYLKGYCGAKHGVRPQREGDYYALYGTGLSDFPHAVDAGDDGRLSITYRFVLV